MAPDSGLLWYGDITNETKPYIMNETGKALLELQLLSKWELTAIKEIDTQLASQREQQAFINFVFWSGLKFGNWSRTRFQKMFSFLYTGILALRFSG